MGRIREFFSDVKEFTKEALLLPIEMMRDDDWVGKTLGGLLATVYAGLTFAIGALVWDGVKNPEYSYEDKDPKTGAITQVDVTPSKQYVLHRLNSYFAKAADFKAHELYDADISYSTTYIPITQKIGNSYITTMSPVTTENITYSNGISFNAAAKDSSSNAEVKKMEKYLKQAENSFSNRVLRVFN